MDTPDPNAHNPVVPSRSTKAARSLSACAAGLAVLAAITASPAAAEPTAPVKDQGVTSAIAQDSGVLTEAIVTLHSGRRISGFLIESSDERIVLRINGIDTTFLRSRVAGLKVLPAAAERFRTLRGAVEDDDIKARMALVEWLRTRRAYSLALEELESILVIEPTNSDAITIRDWIKAHLELNSRSTVRRKEPAPRRTPEPPPIPVLNAEQINRIRIFEIDLNAPTRLHVPEETMRMLMVRSPESFPVDVEEREDILDADPIEQLRILFELRARDLYGTVTIREDPPTMSTFKSRVHGSGGWLANACASNRCHGGSEAGRLRLLNRRPNSDETAYTNFYILDNFRLADGTPLIDHDEPPRSPLLHLALPRRASLYPHPEVDPRVQNQQWRHVFRSTNDRRFRETAAWIGSLYRPRPDYGIEYPPASNPEGGEQTSEQSP
ncbi:MAG: hypothetical protein AAGA55_04500, partial [Planctomycetota bacterium]